MSILSILVITFIIMLFFTAGNAPTALFLTPFIATKQLYKEGYESIAMNILNIYGIIFIIGLIIVAITFIADKVKED